MADTGGFRTKFGGFNKEDVLAYIDSLQQEHAHQLAAVQQQADAQREAYDKALNDANAALAEQFAALQEERAEQDKLQQLINEQYEANRVLREQAETAQHAQAEAQQAKADAVSAKEQVAALSQQVAALKAQLAQAQAANAALQGKQDEWAAQKAQHAALQSQLQAAQAERARLENNNGRYQQLVGDVGSFVVEVRAMGQRYLEDANTRCQGRLTAISGAIAALSEQLTAAAAELSAADEALTAQNSSAEQRLEELARELENSTAAMAQPAPSGEVPARFF